jgi:leucyl-tRNA synthetase
VWRLCEDERETTGADDVSQGNAELALRRHIHRTIKVVSEDYQVFGFNTAIARLMELVNHAYAYRNQRGRDALIMGELIDALLKLLAPMAPYITEEQWRRRGHSDSIHLTPWPTYDESLIVEDEVTMVVQVNGKVRDTIEVPADVNEDDMVKRALESGKVRSHLGDRPPAKVITKPPKLVSLVAARD